jgi:hypothetical protein
VVLKSDDDQQEQLLLNFRAWRMPLLSETGTRLPASGFSIRQVSVVWWAPESRSYAYADVVQNDNPDFPSSYNSSIGIFVSDVGALTGWKYLGLALARHGPTAWDATGAATPAAIVVNNNSRVLLAYSGRYKTGAGHSSLMVASAAHPKGPFTRPKEPVPASVYPGKSRQGNEDGEVFWRKPGDPSGHVTLMFETKNAPKGSGLPCTAGRGYCTRAVRSTDGGASWRGGEVLLTRSSTMEPLTAAWFGDRLIYITDGGTRKPAGGSGPLANRTNWLDAYVSSDGLVFEPASPFIVESYWQPHGNCPPRSHGESLSPSCSIPPPPSADVICIRRMYMSYVTKGGGVPCHFSLSWLVTDTALNLRQRVVRSQW